MLTRTDRNYTADTCCRDNYLITTLHTFIPTPPWKVRLKRTLKIRYVHSILFNQPEVHSLANVALKYHNE